MTPDWPTGVKSPHVKMTEPVSHANNHLITGVPNDDFNAEVASPDGTRGFFGHGDKKKQERYLEQRGNASDFELLLRIFFAEDGMASETLRRPLRGGD